MDSYFNGGLINGKKGKEPSKNSKETREYGFGNEEIEISCSA